MFSLSRAAHALVPPPVGEVLLRSCSAWLDHTVRDLPPSSGLADPVPQPGRQAYLRNGILSETARFGAWREEARVARSGA